MGISVIILAAGKGTRMRSSLPKVLHPIANKPMVQHVIDTANGIGANNIHLVYGHGGEQLKEQLSHNNVEWVLQAEQLGTGHAVQVAMPNIPDDHRVVILYGDVPLTQLSTLEKLMAVKPDNGIGLLTVILDDPMGYGRIVREDNRVVGIIEQKDAAPEQLLINEVNTGILVADASNLKNWLNNLSNDNAQGEYYLTDIIAMAHEQGCQIETAHPASAIEVEGANNRVQLAALERAFQARQAETLMLNGASLADPARIDVRGDVTTGQDVSIDVNVIFEGKVTIGNNVKIGANCILRDCQIGDNTVIEANSIIDDASVAEQCTIGPFGRLRPGSVMEQGAKLGNFVEMKKSTLGKGAKANHFTYLGDTTVGEKANIGAGTITCNYDGVNKFQTHIGAGAFIGSNSSLVAPVSIADNATVGAGSTIVKNVEAEELAVARGKQRNISSWQRPEKK
ncbi:bifunctional UDP-N-acetylglucosamine diphosphorylase/glucosamine-1-phosphate N-acetyltransferase GlmU [Flocculibacter collagenilyticus]|uniref:bifunctional UDP-N-acetylglucosamine diphosphorylase/glucosamine-1-phosphate N-acetyltransferase GlmU n=1 Tax=Flocculibacter collagenilyticus TaxID=2744479 RepID=UPI0018F49561|nr:bifunctional UDP-N-acetylglucosamine diphosphorylase/glucosamine-1-phosphate N-acetyltransferase GlmU [Flocculibacter collagenilyticus]